MGESRLEKGLKAAAWTVLAATVAALLAVGLWVHASDAASVTPGDFNQDGAAAEVAPTEATR